MGGNQGAGGVVDMHLVAGYDGLARRTHLQLDEFGVRLAYRSWEYLADVHQVVVGARVRRDAEERYRRSNQSRDGTTEFPLHVLTLTDLGARVKVNG